RLVVTAVEKSAPVFFPGRVRKLDPLEEVWPILPTLDVAHLPLLPIGTGSRETVSHQLGVIAHVNAAQRDRAIFREQVWIDQLARLFEKVGRGVENILVLQPGVLG